MANVVLAPFPLQLILSPPPPVVVVGGGGGDPRRGPSFLPCQFAVSNERRRGKEGGMGKELKPVKEDRHATQVFEDSQRLTVQNLPLSFNTYLVEAVAPPPT